VTKEARTVDSVRYEALTAYDARDRVTSVTYPSDAEVRYVYNAAGQLDRVTDAAGTTVYASFSSYDPFSRALTTTRAGGKTRTTAAFHAQKQTLASLKTDSLATGSAVPVQNLAYGFDAVGNLMSITDGVDSSQSQTFAYDSLNRLTSAAGFYGAQTFSYDDLGNFVNKGAQAFSYGNTAHPHALTATATANLARDGSTLFARDCEASEPDIVASGVPLSAGYRGAALSFDGVDDVYVNSASESMSPAEFTLMAWVRPTAYPAQGYATIVAKSTGATLGRLSSGARLLLDPSGKAVFEMGRASAPLSFTSVAAIPLNKWTFLCVSFDGGKARMIVNAYQQSSRLQTWSAIANAAPLTVGASVDSGRALVANTAFKGLIDEVRYQGRAWGISEIEDLYDAYRAGWTMTIDANGNCVAKTNGVTTWKYTFDADGRLAKVTENDLVRASFVYDGAGARVKKTTSQGTTLYIGKLYEQRPNGDRVDHVYAGGQHVCDIVRGSSTTQTYYYHPDHLGSVAIVSDSGGNVVQELTYGPFGEAITTEGASPLRHKYTGQEEDPEIGLYYYNARYYDPAIGRFISPDDLIPSSSDSQALNRYAYVRNSPTGLTDPTGNSPFGAIGAIIGGISGAIQGYEYARSRGYEWYRLETLGYMQLGGIVGAASGGAGGMVYGHGGFMAGTKGIAVSSFLYSTAMSTLFGDGPDPTVGIGFGSYNFSSGNFGYLGEKGNSTWQNVGYGFGALANIQDLVALFNGTEISVNSASVKKPNESWGHSSITNDSDSVDISVGPGTPVSDNYFETRAGSYWNNHASEASTWKIRIPNVNEKLLSQMTANVKAGLELSGKTGLKWNLLGYSCVNHASRALWSAGVPTLPINFHPLVLNSQLAIRQVGIQSNPYLIGNP
jgi:RHS repeat-associated protein